MLAGCSTSTSVGGERWRGRPNCLSTLLGYSDCSHTSHPNQQSSSAQSISSAYERTCIVMGSEPDARDADERWSTRSATSNTQSARTTTVGPRRPALPVSANRSGREVRTNTLLFLSATRSS